MIIKSKDEYDRAYKKVHAMYMKGYSYEDMYRECSDLAKWEVMEIVQTIWGREQQRRERRKEAESE